MRSILTALMLASCATGGGIQAGPVQLNQQQLDVIATALEVELDLVEAELARDPDEDAAKQVAIARAAVVALRSGQVGLDMVGQVKAATDVFRAYLAARGWEPDRIETYLRPVRIGLAIVEVALAGQAPAPE